MIRQLRQLMEVSNVSSADIARYTGYTPASISMLLNGKREFSDERLIEVLTKTKPFGLNFHQAKQKIAIWRFQEYADWAGIELPEGAIPMADNFEYVPLLADVSCGEGVDMEAIMEGDEYEALVPVPKEHISDKKKTFAFTAVGDSMSPEIFDGNTVIVEHTKEYFPTKIQLIKYGSEFMFGRVVQTAKGFEIDKTNSTYPSIRVPAGADFEVCGVVKAVFNMRVY